MAVDDNEGQTFLPRTRKTRALMALLAMCEPETDAASATGLTALEPTGKRAGPGIAAAKRARVAGYAWALPGATSSSRIGIIYRCAARNSRSMHCCSLSQRGYRQNFWIEYDDVLLEDLNGLDPAFDRWLENERGRFVRIRRTIGESLLAQYDDPLAAIEAAEQILVLDRRHEAAWRALMRCHAERGDIRAAVAAYDRCRGALAETRGRAAVAGNRGTDRSHPCPEPVCPIRAATWDAISRGRRYRSLRLPGRRPSATVRTLRLRVVPLRTIGEERDDGLGIGLAEEISAGLSRFRWISCLPATLWPSGTPAGHSGAILLMRPTVGGPASKPTSCWMARSSAAGRVRIIVRLIDMRAGGEIVWAGTIRPRHDRSACTAGRSWVRRSSPRSIRS